MCWGVWADVLVRTPPVVPQHRPSKAKQVSSKTGVLRLGSECPGASYLVRLATQKAPVQLNLHAFNLLSKSLPNY